MQRISENAAFYVERTGDATSDILLYFILEELWQTDDQIDSYQQRENKSLRDVAFIKKILTTKRDYEYKDIRKIIHVSQNIPSRKRPHQCDSFGNALKHNLDLHSHNKNNASKNINNITEYDKISSYTEQEYTPEKLWDHNHVKILSYKQISSQHQKIHTGEKSYECAEFVKIFTQQSQLKVHLRVHTGEKLYVCVDCGKAFVKKPEFITHQRTHTREKILGKRLFHIHCSCRASL